jgi:hypothetical protein
MDQDMPRNQDEAFLNELETLEPVPGKFGQTQQKKKPPQGQGKSKRIRVSSNMVSARYRVGQLWKNAGIELILIILLFFCLRHMLYTGSVNDEGRQIAAQSIQLAQGELSLGGGEGAPSAAEGSFRVSSADSVLLPLGLISLITGGGKTVLDLVTIFLALASILCIYAAGKELFAPETGIAAAAILTILPAFITRAAGLYLLTFAFAYAALALWLLVRSRRNDSAWSLLIAGAAISFAIHAESLFIYLLAFLALFFWTEMRTKLRNIGLVLGGFILSEIILAVFFLITTGHKPFGYLTSLFASPANAALAGGGYASLADLFEQLFTNPQVLPFSLLAILAIGYTLRASKSSFPYQPLLLFSAAYFTLELLPQAFSPFTTLPVSDRMLAVMSPAFALLLGTFLAGLSNRMTIRWFLAGLNVLALPLLFFY